MKIINSNKIKTCIGFDIGDGVMNFLIKAYTILPFNFTEKFIIKDIDQEYISIYEGINYLSENNKFLLKLPVVYNKLHFLEIKVLNDNLIFLNLFDKSDNQKRIVTTISNYNLFIDEKLVNINNIKLKYIFKFTKNKILNKLENNNLLPKKIKDNITKKLVLIDNNLENMENQQLIEKITLLNEKFIL